MRTSLQQTKWGLFNLIEGDFISQFVKAYGEWSEVEVQFFRSILSSHSNIIEVGANIGIHSVPLAKFAPQGKLFCFEPQRIIFQTLCANISLNHLTNVYAYHQGVSNQKEEIEIPSSNYDTVWNYGSFSLDKGFDTEGNFQGSTHNEWVQVVTLDKHPEIQKLTELSLLKIDAEGFDLNVLKGATNIINQYKPVIFIEAHPHKSEAILNYLNQLDYQCFWFISDRYQPNNYFNQEKTISGLDYNLACFHRTKTSTLPIETLAKPEMDLSQVPRLTYQN
ncbi:FkbM family methyltransferase [Rodentibacter pneumotropicus]|uniref:FkbM family methyltransferase n=1 Tax=Rodentibacter pneumotropicus TaxID=758 RepID=A0A4S2PSK6_9PAST|nr:FkbM family methyltransferase [Rodentibacter pneumotropicus]MDC2824645.1 FkbM family methyltransferase [Rodentibacter pneumotropicus]NBH74647.1 FkbM family methyltransferase [Rodentibacter pneumotropicus]OOF64081.1 hypothetical protein BKL50_02115 [Rodentibacter pneumotropicus]OOF65064.1 hypothetical protein BH925_05540 [Rodentibacter pneumotropicus]THA00617.1 FkbM family methyltransferase [Rodentibacter pneumotropicus]